MPKYKITLTETAVVHIPVPFDNRKEFESEREFCIKELIKDRKKWEESLIRKTVLAEKYTTETNIRYVIQLDKGN